MRSCPIMLTAMFVTVLCAQEKTEVVMMTPEEFAAIKTGKTPEADAKKQWEGKKVSGAVSSSIRMPVGLAGHVEHRI
jgi:hypothetical protein